MSDAVKFFVIVGIIGLIIFGISQNNKDIPTQSVLPAQSIIGYEEYLTYLDFEEDSQPTCAHWCVTSKKQVFDSCSKGDIALNSPSGIAGEIKGCSFNPSGSKWWAYCYERGIDLYGWSASKTYDENSCPVYSWSYSSICRQPDGDKCN